METQFNLDMALNLIVIKYNKYIKIKKVTLLKINLTEFHKNCLEYFEVTVQLCKIIPF